MVRAKPQTLADDLTRLAQVSIRVADLWFTLRGNLQIPVLEEVNPNQLVQGGRSSDPSGKTRRVSWQELH